MTDHRRHRAAALTILLALGLAGCSAIGTGPAPSASGSGGTVTLVTHDSFALPDDVLAAFTAQTGLRVRTVSQGDAGALVNQLVLTKDAPLGDAFFGVDNTFGSRALGAGVATPAAGLTAAALADAKTHALPGDQAGALVAIDYGDVCVNVDDAWFAAKGITPPKTLDDLTRPAYKNLFVTPSPVVSSPGFAFLLATIAAKGTDWPAYWTALKANGVQVAASWTDAYESSFTAGGGNGDRPIVLSYSSSPPFTVPKGGTEPTTSALLGACFRQTEYAGVLTGAKNPTGAAKLVDFLLSDKAQAAIPDAMYMYPVSTKIALPADWKTWAPVAADPYTVDPATIAANRTTWLQQWTDLGVG